MQFGKKCTNRIYSKAVLIYFSPVRIGNRSQGAHFIGALLDYYFFDVALIIIIIIIILNCIIHHISPHHLIVCLKPSFLKKTGPREPQKKKQTRICSLLTASRHQRHFHNHLRCSGPFSVRTYHFHDYSTWFIDFVYYIILHISQPHFIVCFKPAPRPFFIIIYGVSDHFQREHTIFMIIQRVLLIWYIILYRIILYCTTYHISQPHLIVCFKPRF